MATASQDPAAQRYSSLAILLHWVIALAIAGQIWLGWYEQDMPDHSPAQYKVLDVHISIGVTILALTLVRVALRLTRPPPPLPAGMPAWERLLARGGHLLLYLLMLGLPLTGWVLASMGPRPISVWGLGWPHLPVGGLVEPAQRRAAHHLVEDIHGSILVWSGIALAALHVAGALKHQFDRTPVLWRMVPGIRPPA
jgi:cytochrome b561